MNVIRERVLLSIPPYTAISEHKDLIAFCICSESFLDWEDEETGIYADFDEVVAIVEKDWLFSYMEKEDPLDYIKNEYTSDDAINWFDEAIRLRKIVMISFN